MSLIIALILVIVSRAFGNAEREARNAEGKKESPASLPRLRQRLRRGDCLPTIEGFATYYTRESCQREGNGGLVTASGEAFEEEALTCALRSREFGQKWKVTCIETGRSIIVLHTDYGPGRGPRSRGVIIDLTPAGFRGLGVELRRGKVRVRMEEVSEYGSNGVSESEGRRSERSERCKQDLNTAKR